MSHEHYFRDVTHLERLDVYRVLDLFGVECPVAQHVIKKAMAAGKRGHKSLRKDWQDIADSANRRLRMLDEDARIEKRREAGRMLAEGVHRAASGAVALALAHPAPVGTPVDWPEDEERIDQIGRDGLVYPATEEDGA